jgi:hypothetical protein
LAENAFDARETYFVFALYLYHANAKQIAKYDEVFHKSLVERRRNNYPLP